MENLNQHAALLRIAALVAGPTESALLICGEPGLGKSHLLSQAASAATETIQAAYVQGRPAEAPFELSGISAVFEMLLGTHQAPFADQLNVGSDRPERLFAAAQELTETLQGLKLRPTVILIDDIDVMDPLSQSLISIVSGHLAGTNVRIVATATARSDGSPLNSIPTVALKPFSPTEINELAEQLAPHARVSTLQILTQYVAGNPLVLTELIAEIEPFQLAGIDWLTLPPRNTAAVEAIAVAQVDGLEQGHATLLETIALSPATHVAALRQVSPDAADLLDDLADLALVRVHGAYVSVVDPRVRRHLHWRLTSRTRRERLAALADLTDQFDPQLAVWCRSGSMADPDKTDALLAAASTLVSQSRTEEAIELAEKALARAHDMSQHSEQIANLSSRLLRAGELDLSERYSGRALASASTPHEHLRLATLRASARLLAARRMPDDEAHTLVSLHSATNHDAAGDLLALAAIHRAERWEVDQARALLAPAIELNGQLNEVTQRKLAMLSSALDALDGIPADSADPLDDIGGNETGLPPDLLLLRGRALTWRERYAESRRTFTIVLNHPHTSAPLWRQLATFGSIGNEIGAGEFHLARESIQTWLIVAPQAMAASSEHLLILAWRAYCTGHFDSSLEYIEACLHQASREASQSTRARALALRGTIGLLNADPEAVVTDLRQVTTTSVLFRNPGLLRHWPDYVEACLLTGRLQEAGAARRALERRLTTHHSRWGSLAALRIDAMLAEDQAPELFTTAIKHFGPDDNPYELGRTLLAYANQLTANGRDPEANRTLTSAISAFERAGADAWVKQVAGHRGTSAGNSMDQLSAEERDITRRVSEGERNRDIAMALHLSIRTVELRLTHIYRTLGIHSRAELITRMNDPRSGHRR